MKIKSKKNLSHLLFIILIILILIFFLKQISNKQTIDDFMFLKLFSNSQTNIEKEVQENQSEYKFNITYKNMDFKSVNLIDTIDKNTLIYEKIAPGTKGSFNIIIESNQYLRYRILFSSLNKKPKNLKFKAYEENLYIAEANTLEELAKKIVGYINKNEIINVRIDWYWNYELNDENNIQDTNDAKNIRQYQFDVLAIGEEL